MNRPNNPSAQAVNAARQARSRADCEALDADDTLAPLREQFVHPPGVIYLDGNSLGLQPKATAARVQAVVEQEWGQGLIRSWNDAGWITLAGAIGDRIAGLIGAGEGEVMVADSTSINLYKALSAALSVQRQAGRLAATSRGQPVILSQPDNFPTDLYIAQSMAEVQGLRLELCPAEGLDERLADSTAAPVAVLMLTHVNYRTGFIHDMGRLTRAAHDAGALMLWDLAHSAGAVVVDLHGADADFAVGCGYKFLNGGPGAPAFVWAHPRWASKAEQPLQGWLGHAAPFAFDTAYAPAAGIQRFVCGTPPVISLSALACGVETVRAADALGGMAALHAKAQALTELFIALVRTRCPGFGLELISPEDPTQRGCQVSWRSDDDAYAMVQALIARGVIGDFRAPDILRFGFTPLTLRFVDVWDAVSQLEDMLKTSEWRQPQFRQRQAVT
jgi:kynureninase